MYDFSCPTTKRSFVFFEKRNLSESKHNNLKNSTPTNNARFLISIHTNFHSTNNIKSGHQNIKWSKNPPNSGKQLPQSQNFRLWTLIITHRCSRFYGQWLTGSRRRIIYTKPINLYQILTYKNPESRKFLSKLLKFIKNVGVWVEKSVRMVNVQATPRHNKKLITNYKVQQPSLLSIKWFFFWNTKKYAEFDKKNPACRINIDFGE
jgi:hypothetical protein